MRFEALVRKHFGNGRSVQQRRRVLAPAAVRSRADLVPRARGALAERTSDLRVYETSIQGQREVLSVAAESFEAYMATEDSEPRHLFLFGFSTFSSSRTFFTPGVFFAASRRSLRVASSGIDPRRITVSRSSTIVILSITAGSRFR